ncbi:MAG: PqiA/YebS family transporter subunit [Proteobacteria bacterium]|uniref:PqiA/YebS family transporter subunit n=1 Tax=Candidatus Avisuccinivibrio stercorigallinarum TaxID=2840704 RepID=A0A9D9DC85_9GAMM|nr:PqiA/YebS family transporter subunit [Candidatus Avisuccinivibrio stercorigallinarum]
MQQQVVLCRSCDKPVLLPPYQKGIKAVCPHCGATLRSGHLVSLHTTAIVALSALILLFNSIFVPFLSIESLGIYEEMSLSSIFSVLKTDWSSLLYIFLAFTFLLPFVMLLQQVLAGLFRLQPERRFCKLYALCHRFCMVDVFVFGILVSLVKLTSLASVQFHVGFFLGLAFSLMLIWCWVKAPPRLMWDMFKESQVPIELERRGIEQGLVCCPRCGMVYKAAEHQRCPRCEAPAHYRISQSMQKTVALLAAALILYLPSNLYPVMYTDYMGSNQGSNIIDGVISLWQMNSEVIALIILCASIFIPVFKILMLMCLICLTHSAKIKKPALLSRIYRVISFIGKWSMIDVFVVIIMSSTVRMSGLLTINPGFAIIAFCSVVLITMAAAENFDERLLWDNSLENKAQEKGTHHD